MSNLKTLTVGWLIQSEDIKVFPCAYRGTDINEASFNPEARLNTEYNYTHLPHIVDKKSYIISNKAPDDKENGLLCCVVGGYYFEITYTDDDKDKFGSDYYLNIRVASPASTTDSTAIAENHLVAYEYNASTLENDLDSAEQGKPYYFLGLLITKDSKYDKATDYLKLDDSAYLPIKSYKIANGDTGDSISDTFNTNTLTVATNLTANKITAKELLATDTLTATGKAIFNDETEVNNKFTVNIANKDKLTVTNETTQVKNTLNTLSDLNVKGTAYGTSITATGKIISTGDDTRKIAAGIEAPNGTISGKNLSASEEISGKTGNITNTLTVGSSISLGTQNINNNDSTIIDLNAIAGKYIDVKSTKKITEKVKEGNNETEKTIVEQGGSLFNIDRDTGIVYAAKINAPVEGISKDAKNVTETIANKEITAIFESNGLVAQKASSITATSTTSDAGSTIVTGTAASKVLSLLPGAASKANNCTYNIGSTNRTFDNVYAANFKEGLADNANKISARLNGNTQITTILTGSVTKNSSNSNKYDLLLTPNTDANIASIDLGTNNNKFNNVYATAFQGDLKGNADMATNAGTANTVSTKIKNVDITAIFVPDPNNTDNITSEVKAANYATRANTITSYAGSKQIVYGSYTQVSSAALGNNIAALLPSVADNTDYNIGSLNNKFNTIYAKTFDGDATGVNTKKIENIKVNDTGLKTSSLVSVNFSSGQVSLGVASYGALINRTSSGTTFIVNSAKTTGNILEANHISASSGSSSATTSSTVFKVDYAGNVTATTYNATSDRRLKENIVDYKPKKSILDLQVKKFDFINGLKNQIGCIAQDLQEICPEIVVEDKDGMLSIKESKIVYLLLDEVKKLKAEVDELKNK